MSDVLQKPTWVPYYIQRMKGSRAWKELKDFQFCWYWKLLTELADSAEPGYLPNDVGVLWELAGAQTEVFFRTRGGLELLARHFNRTEDGRRIYNERMLKVLHEQGIKRAREKRRRHGTLLSVVSSLPDWIPEEEFKNYMEMRDKIRKPLTAHAIKLLVSKLEKLRNAGDEPKEVLNEATLNCWQSVWPLRKEANGKGAPGFAAEGRRNGDDDAVSEAISWYRSHANPECKTCHGTGLHPKGGTCECYSAEKKA